MAITGRTQGVANASAGAMINESVSFTSAAGDQASFRSVPAGKLWVLQTLRATNPDAAVRGMMFKITDIDGTTHACLPSGALPVQVPAVGSSAAYPGVIAWDGQIYLPPTWRVYAEWRGMTVGLTCNWQYTAHEFDL